MTRLRIECLEDRAVPAVATWDGGGADNKWTTAANWAGDVAPKGGDELVFPLGAGQRVNVNDFAPQTLFHSIKFTDYGYQISGNAIQLAAGVVADLPLSLAPIAPTLPSPDLGLNLTLTADQTFTSLRNGGL